jgi:histidine triad (HIT) family protein
MGTKRQARRDRDVGRRGTTLQQESGLAAAGAVFQRARRGTMPSIFSRIVAGEIPAVTLYEDDDTLAFMDISPAARGHALVICKQEHADLYAIPPELLAATARTVQKVAHALHRALAPDGLNIVQNNGTAAGQTVFHYHVHLIPRWENDGVLHLWHPRQASPEELHALADQIRAAL